jgi:small subunit ribosomal protein S18e
LSCQSSVILARANEFQYLLRMMNTNLNGKHKVGFSLRTIKGIGRRFAILVCKIAQVDTNRRAGDLTEEEINKISDIFAKPTGKCDLAC